MSNNEHAVVLAGDFRTMMHGLHTYSEMFEGADVYLSIWRESRTVHKAKLVPPIDHGNMGVIQAIDLFRKNGVELQDWSIEHYNPQIWTQKGYNSGYLHRQRMGIDLILASGITYKTVFFSRPDMFFGRNVSILRERVRSCNPGDYVTIYAMPDRIRDKRRLNDIMFGVRYQDLDRAVPTVEQYQMHKHRDWHTFYYDWIVTQEQFNVVNVPEVETVILRPPTNTSMDYAQAVANVQKWDDTYVIHAINRFGVREAIRQWDKTAVLRAIQNLDVE